MAVEAVSPAVRSTYLKLVQQTALTVRVCRRSA
jgi:hypothetical protein